LIAASAIVISVVLGLARMLDDLRKVTQLTFVNNLQLHVRSRGSIFRCELIMVAVSNAFRAHFLGALFARITTTFALLVRIILQKGMILISKLLQSQQNGKMN
jgi:hypothetical protein